MDINKDNYFKIIKNNLPYSIVDTEIGQAVKMNPRDAFIYCCVTGSGYLENPVYPFTPKGLLKLFYNAFDYKFVTGIFDNTILKNTPLILSKAKPYLFDGDKYIIPVEFEAESELNKYLNSIYSTIVNPSNYIIQRIEASKKGNGMEPLMEYLVAEYFKNIGYVVENQIPLAHAIGSPDFGGYGLEKIINTLKSSGFLQGNGFHIVELSLLRLNKPSDVGAKSLYSNKMLVGEAKTGSGAITNQLCKYLDTGLFDIGYEIRPFKEGSSNKTFGLFTIDQDFKIQIKEPNETYIPKKQISKHNYLVWLENYMKFYLIANFTNDELNKMFSQKYGRKITNQPDIVKFVLETTIEEILEQIKEVKNVTIE
jgi:hypothetical protein